MDHEPENRPGFAARIAADPIRLRRRSWVALLVLIVMAIAGRLLAGPAGGLMTAFTWICVPAVALGIGVGDAFFIRHGRGIRRIILTILAAAFTALSSCVILAGASTSSSSLGSGSAVAVLYALFLTGIVVGLAGLIALGIGRGEDYVSRRIDRMSREDW